jgi:homospermidine synthase
MAKTTFTGRILFLGCGSVAQCSLPLVLEQIDVDPARVTVLDMLDNRARVAPALARGVRYEIGQVRPDNLDEVLGRHLGPGDICLDMAWNIDNCTILQWCRDHDVRYLNSSVEVWDPYDDAASAHPLDRTLYVRHMAMRRMIASWPDNRGPSAVVEHGANPGLVSHWVKQALTEIGERALRENRSGAARPAVERALAERAYNHLAHALGVKVVHIAERDTQITDRPKQVDEFVNTWSVDGFYEEGIAPAEVGWGTHERRMPPGAFQHAGEGPGNQICLPRMGAKTWVRSRVPSCEITGMVIRHGEAFTMCDHLTVWDGPRPVYRPTVHYAYCPADVAIASMHELEMRRWEMQPSKRILNDEIISGRDELGVLLMGHPFRSWWTGSMLSIDEARALVPNQNATTLQVAASVLGAVRWMISSPHEGVRVPDELPWDDVLAAARPYLGTQWSGPIDWDPLTSRNELFQAYDTKSWDEDDPWQFTNFLV